MSQVRSTSAHALVRLCTGKAVLLGWRSILSQTAVQGWTVLEVSPVPFSASASGFCIVSDRRVDERKDSTWYTAANICFVPRDEQCSPVPDTSWFAFISLNAVKSNWEYLLNSFNISRADFEYCSRWSRTSAAIQRHAANAKKTHVNHPADVIEIRRTASVCVILRRITLQVRNTSTIGCIAWANTANTVCRLQTDASLPRDSSASVQSPPTHPLFFLETFAHLHSHTETCTALSSSHRSQISTKYRRWCRAIGSCQMRPHYQALVFVHNNQPLHLFLCLAFSTHGHSGQTKYSRALPLGLSLLPHATPLCTPPHPHPPFKPLIWSKRGTVASPASRVTRALVSSPFIETRWHYSNNQGSVAPERWRSNIHSDVHGDVCLHESIFGRRQKQSS